MRKTPPRVTADKEEKVGIKDRGSVYADTCCPLSSTIKTLKPPVVDQSDLQQDWAAGQTAKRKRGRKPKVLMGVNPNRPHNKDGRASEKQDVREEKSDSESSEHGELQYPSHIKIFLVCSPQPNTGPADDHLAIEKMWNNVKIIVFFLLYLFYKKETFRWSISAGAATKPPCDLRARANRLLYI